PRDFLYLGCRLRARVPDGELRRNPDLRDRLHRGDTTAQGERLATSPSLDLAPCITCPPPFHRRVTGRQRGDCRGRAAHTLRRFHTTPHDESRQLKRALTRLLSSV